MDAREMSPESRACILRDDEDNEAAAFLLAGVGSPTVELSDTSASLRGRPLGRLRMVELDASESALVLVLFGGIASTLPIVL